jgi:uncharacterized protein (DUF1501 family)
MKRRDFLKNMPVALLPSIIGGASIKAYGNNPLLAAMTAGLIETDRVLVIVQLSGGNDGLNTVIPLDQYAAYNTVRSNAINSVAIPEDKILKLKGTNGKAGLHPAMQRFWELYEEDKMNIVQSVGYPNFNFSHFRATDIWMSGSDANQFLSSGWAGRYLNYEYANYPVGYPNSTMPDPIAIRIGGGVGLGLQNLGVNMGMTITNTNDTLDLKDYIFTDPVSSDTPGQKLAYIREVQRQTDKFGDVIKAAGDKGKNLSTLYPSTTVGTTTSINNGLARDLSIVAKLISGGLKTRIYWVNIGGFDTHANQVTATDKTQGTHATLLKTVSDSIYAFLDDCKKLGIADRVIGFTFSEFGRRIRSNGSGGTDHGAAAPMFIFGNKVKSGITGDNPTIDANASANANLPMQYDFRSIYASVLKDWFCVPQSDLDGIMLNNFQSLPLINPSVCLPTETHDANVSAGDNMIMAYPNPFTEATTIKYESQGGHTSVQVFNTEGIIIKTLVDDINHASGQFDIRCDLGFLPSGVYYVRLQNGELQQVKPMMKIN